MTISAHSAGTTTCRVAGTIGELATHHAIRHAVFVREQAVFAHDDHDLHDTDAATLHVLGFVDGVAAGAVRLFPLDPSGPGGVWQGDRLAVLPEHPGSGIAQPRVRFAVATAGALGGRRMIAHVQLPNRAFFGRLGWTARGEPELYVGLPHQLMDIELAGS